MAKKKRKKICGEMAPWMITFSDVMTLMLTFFVLLVSMAKVDEHRKMVVLGSIIGTFGWGESTDPMSTQKSNSTVDPGVIEGEADLQMLKPMLWEDGENDLNFESNHFVQVFSINSELLYQPGSTELSQSGMEFLDKIVPVIKNVQYPLLIAGHTSSLRDELRADYQYTDAETLPSPAWKISLYRALGVYRYLLAAGVEATRLSVESFGSFHPHYSGNDPNERDKNRRVDIVLDKRNSEDNVQELENALKENESKPEKENYDIDGFKFELHNLDKSGWE